MEMFFIVMTITALISSTFAQSSVCSLPHSANGDGEYSCRARFPAWSYDSNTKQCVEFIYGGCGGNRNRFGSQRSCENRCKGYDDNTSGSFSLTMAV